MANTYHDQLSGADLHDNKEYPATGTPLPSWTPTDGRYVRQTRNVSTSAPLTGGGNLSADRTLSMPAATSLVDGYLRATDWATFNAKQPFLGFAPVNKAGDTLVGALLGLFEDKGGQVYHALAYGAVADALTATDGVMTANSAILTSASANFTSADVGKTIVVFGAWSGGQSLKTTIASRQSSTQVTLALAAQATVSGAKFDWGTNNAPYIQAAGNAAIAAGGGRVYLGLGTFLTGGTISFKSNNVSVIGGGAGFTTIKATGGYEILSFGNASASTVYRNLNVENLTIDMNNIASGFTYGLIIGAYKNVTVRNVHVLNKAAGAANQLYFGVSSGSSAEYARDAIFENCVFDQNGGGAESVLLAQARNVRFLNCTISNVTSAYGLLQYGSTRCSYIGNTFENGATVSISRRPTRIVGNHFLASRMEITGCENAEVLGNIFDGGASFVNCGISVKAEVQTTNGEVGWDNPIVPFTRRSTNVQIIGNHFYRCNSMAIQAAETISDTGATILPCDNLLIQGNTIRDTYWQGIDVKAKRLTIDDNHIYNSGQLGNTTVSQNMVIAGERVIVSNNYSYDDQGTPTALRDFVINNTLSGSALPTQDITFRDNDFSIGSIPAFNNSGTIVTTKPGNVTLHWGNNRGYTTEGSGTATIASGFTSVVVTHGLSVTPAPKDITVTPTNSLGSAAKFWVSNPTSTQFTINVDTDPGATTATLAWKAVVL